MLINRGIEANPDKYEAMLKMRSPINLKEVQRLVGRLIALARSLSVLSERMKPIINL